MMDRRRYLKKNIYVRQVLIIRYKITQNMLSYEGCAGGVIVSTSEIEIVEQSSNSDFVTFTFVQRPLEKA